MVKTYKRLVKKTFLTHSPLPKRQSSHFCCVVCTGPMTILITTVSNERSYISEIQIWHGKRSHPWQWPINSRGKKNLKRRQDFEEYLSHKIVLSVWHAFCIVAGPLQRLTWVFRRSCYGSKHRFTISFDVLVHNWKRLSWQKFSSFFLTQIQRTLCIFTSIYFSVMCVSVVIVFMYWFLVIVKRVDNHSRRLISKNVDLSSCGYAYTCSLFRFVHGRVAFSGCCPSNS